MLTLALLALGCFARLAARPDGLLVDPDRPSVDYTQRDEIRGVGNDLTGLFLPHGLHVAQAWRRGDGLPLWDDSGSGGRPMVGNPQAGLFYPPAWLAWRSGAAAALGWTTFAHLIGGGIGVYVLMRSLGLGRIGATMAGACFEACPYLAAQVFEGHYPHVWAACWYPWMFWAIAEHRAGRLRGTMIAPVVPGLVFLTGHPQEWVYLVTAIGFWTLADVAESAWNRDLNRAARAAGGFLAIVAVSLGFVALELLPDLAASAWSPRAARLRLGQVNRFYLHALHFFQLLSPDAVGGPSEYFGHDNYWETALSFGVASLPAVLLALLRPASRRQATAWFALVAASILFAAGRRFGLYTLLFHLVPLMDRFRVPARSLFLAALGVSALAGMGVDALARGLANARDLRKILLLPAAIVVFVALGLVAARRDGQGPTPRIDRAREILQTDSGPLLSGWRGLENRRLMAFARIGRDGVFWMSTLGAAGILGWLAQRAHHPKRRTLAAGLFTALAVLELGLDDARLYKVSNLARFAGPDPISDAIRDAARRGPDFFRIRARDSLYADLRAATHGFHKTNVYDLFQIDHAARMYETLFTLCRKLPPRRADHPMDAAVADFRSRVRQGVLDRMCVAFLVADGIDDSAPWPCAASGLWNGSPYAVYRNPTALPRAYVAPRAVASWTGDAPQVAQLAHVDPRAAVILPRDPLTALGIPDSDDARQQFTPAEWLSDKPDCVVIRVRNQRPGLLVVADTWMPDWHARLDGRPVSVERGNVAQRVVALPTPGDHLLTMTYRPASFRHGLALSALSVATWLAYGLLALRARRQMSIPPASNSAPRPAFLKYAHIKQRAIAASDPNLTTDFSTN